MNSRNSFIGNINSLKLKKSIYTGVKGGTIKKQKHAIFVYCINFLTKLRIVDIHSAKDTKNQTLPGMFCLIILQPDCL